MKEYDVILTITHIEAENEEKAIAKAKADSSAIYNSMGEAKEIS